ncbi:MAG: YkgJ family cysteine cluster protein [Candidatus Heimdallarchaeaceae archaeon]
MKGEKKEESQEDVKEESQEDVKEESQEDVKEESQGDVKEESQGDVKEESQGDVKEGKEPKKPKPKYVHNCTKCGKCCEKWESVPVYLDDLQRWLKDGTIQYVLPFLKLKETPPLYVQIVLQKEEKEDDPNPSGCPLYDYKNKICNIYFSMPIHCAAYPLAYNGEKFYLIDKESPGLGNGSMTKESLQLARQRAQEHYSASISTNSLLPVLYALILNNISRKSKEAMESLSEEDKKKLEELLSKSSGISKSESSESSDAESSESSDAESSEK